MAFEIVENEQTEDAVTSQLFLSTINTWYNERGIHCSVNLVTDFFKTKYSKNAPNIGVKINILEDMPKCRARVIEEGAVVKVEDELTGEQRPKIEIIENPEQVTFFLRLKEVKKQENSEEEKAFISNKSSAFPLINFGAIANGDLPENNTYSFKVNQEDIQQALEGLEFIAKCGKGNFNGKQYHYLVAEPIGQQEILPETVTDTAIDDDGGDWTLTPDLERAGRQIGMIDRIYENCEIEGKAHPTYNELVSMVTKRTRAKDRDKALEWLESIK